jgi:hypothetical protein
MIATRIDRIDPSAPHLRMTTVKPPRLVVLTSDLLYKLRAS